MSTLAPDRLEDELRLADAVDDLDLDAGLALEAVDELGSVLGLAQRRRAEARTRRRAFASAIALNRRTTSTAAASASSADDAVTGDDVAEAEHLLLPHEWLEAAVRTGSADNEQMEGVAPEIEGGDPHPLSRGSPRGCSSR